MRLNVKKGFIDDNDFAELEKLVKDVTSTEGCDDVNKVIKTRESLGNWIFNFNDKYGEIFYCTGSEINPQKQWE